jgi:hypothetical protein
MAMPMHVVNGALLMCTMSPAPSSLVVLPVHREQIEDEFAANIMDHVPMVNIMPFGVCGVLEGPCVPATPMPWTPGSPSVMLDDQPALDDISVLECVIGGTITVLDPGQTTVEIP